MKSLSLQQKRDLLFLARARLAPQVQGARERAVTSMVEDALIILDSERGLTLEQLNEQGAFRLRSGLPFLKQTEVQKCLERLATDGRVERSGSGLTARYRLHKDAREELTARQAEAARNLDAVLTKIFPRSGSDLRGSFLDCIGAFFARLGERNVRLLMGQLTGDEDLTRQTLLRCIDDTIARETRLSRNEFRDGIVRFVLDPGPDAAMIKWRIGQSYYIAKAIGLDPLGSVLTQDLFGGAELYLDTNVLIPALEASSLHARSFGELADLCRSVGASLKACNVSIQELESVLCREELASERAARQVPRETVQKIRSLFARKFLDARSVDSAVTFRELFPYMGDAAKTLAGAHGIERVDDRWFEETQDLPEVHELVRDLQDAYLQRRGRKKTRGAAVHDAQVLRWVRRERVHGNERAWFVTLDSSLPSFRAREIGWPLTPLAISLDSLLQWLAPVVGDGSQEATFETVFAEALRVDVLPSEQVFDIEDFVVFADLKMECALLPAEDVEGLIRWLRDAAPGLDPGKPADRERLAGEISRYLASPERRYRADQDAAMRLLEEAVERHARTENALRGELKNTQDSLEREVLEKNHLEARVGMLEGTILAYGRLAIAIVVGLVPLGIGIMIGAVFGDGENVFRRTANLWQYPSLGALVGLFIGRLIVGPRGRKALMDRFGWGA